MGIASQSLRTLLCKDPTMCNLYSVTKGQQAILDLTRAMFDSTGNLPSMPGVFPDYAAPIVRSTAAGWALVLSG